MTTPVSMAEVRPSRSVHSLHFFVSFFLFTAALHAEVLRPGKVSLHQGFGLRSASSLWMGGNPMDIAAPKPSSGPANAAGRSTQATSASSSSGTVTSLISTTSASVGLAYGFQLDANLQYKYSTLSGGSEGGREDGDFEGGVSEVGVRINKEILTTRDPGGIGLGIVSYFGVRAPGNSPSSGDNFLALNDGTTKFDFGGVLSIRFGQVSLENDFTFIARSDADVASQISLKSALPLNFVKGVSFGPFLHYFNTLDGNDIGDPQFEATGKARGGVMPFSTVKEEFVSLGGFVAVPLGESVYLDASLQRKVTGRNTDIGTGFGVGLGLGF